MNSRVVVTLAAVLAAGTSVARAQGSPPASSELLDKARAEVAQLNYDGAIALFEQAESAGGNTRETMLEIYRAIAEAHAALGRTDQAEVSFRRLLALDPTVQLTAGASPKLTTPFTAANEFITARGPLKVECRKTPASAAEAGVVLTVVTDPVDLVAAARLEGAGGAAVGGDVEGSGRISLPGTGAATCVALDRHKNELARGDVGEAPAEPVATGAGVVDDGTTGGGVVIESGGDGGSRPLYARWYLWGGAAALTGAVAIYYGLQLKKDREDLDKLNANSEEHFFEDALEIEERGDGHARNANIALGVTAALSAVSIGLLVYDLVKAPESEGGTAARRRRSRARVAAGVVPGGAGMQLTVGF